MINPSDSGLSPETIKKITDVFSQYPQIKNVVLYGSRAKGNYRSGSDIDLCITDISSETLSLGNLELDLDDLLLPYAIDLSLFSQIQNTQLIDHIKRIGIVFYSKVV